MLYVRPLPALFLWCLGQFLTLTLQGHSDPVLQWNSQMIEAIRLDNSGPTLSARNLAILHTAIHDSVNSVLRLHQPYRFDIPVGTSTSAEAAAASAGYTVTTRLYPSQVSRAQSVFDEWLAAMPRSSAVTNGLELGELIADLVLQSRSADGSSTDVPYIPSNAPGQWRRTPPFFRPPLTPNWRFVTPFCLEILEPFVSPPPPALNSIEYAEAWNEVKTLGAKNSPTRTAEQSEIAVFWSDFSYTSMPPGHWHLIAENIAQNRQNSLAENARLFALLSLAQADSAIVCWEAKFRYNLWRPITAIQRADEDGNPLTTKDPTWDHFLAAPPFPAYTSGHSTFSKASAQVLTHFYGTDSIPFQATSDSLPGVFREFTSLAACADEVGMSRIYGGIHFSFDNVRGKECGKKIGDFVAVNFLLPVDVLPQIRMELTEASVPQLRVHGRMDTTLMVEASSDLATWSSIEKFPASMGGVTVRDSANSTAHHRFYRVTEVAVLGPR